MARHNTTLPGTPLARPVVSSRSALISVHPTVREAAAGAEGTFSTMDEQAMYGAARSVRSAVHVQDDAYDALMRADNRASGVSTAGSVRPRQDTYLAGVQRTVEHVPEGAMVMGGHHALLGAGAPDAATMTRRAARTQRIEQDAIRTATGRGSGVSLVPDNGVLHPGVRYAHDRQVVEATPTTLQFPSNPMQPSPTLVGGGVPLTRNPQPSATHTFLLALGAGTGLGAPDAQPSHDVIPVTTGMLGTTAAALVTGGAGLLILIVGGILAVVAAGKRPRTDGRWALPHRTQITHLAPWAAAP
jgi:hypothetical protein